MSQIVPRAGVPGETPQRRWEAAVTQRPLEAPQPLPAAVRAMARGITGWTHPPRFTTGPATRHALAAAGALGATTGAVVHLPEAPTGGPASTAVLAHELAHARHPVRRPRFLLTAGSGGAADERAAERIARSAERDAAGGELGTVSADFVGRLSVGNRTGATREEVATLVRAELLKATAGPLTAMSMPDARAIPGNTGIDGTGSVTAPDDATPGGTSGDSRGGGTVAHEGGTDSADQTGATTAAPLDIDGIVQAVEDRLLREVERRGGRWAGVF